MKPVDSTVTILDPIEYRTLAELGVSGGRESCVVAMVKQDSEDWHTLRLGIPTASHASVFVTARGEAAKNKARESYMNRLIGERLTGRREMQYALKGAAGRGLNLEPQARAYWTQEKGEFLEECGIVFRDAEKQAGASPDGLAPDRWIEIKCPERNMLLSTLRGKRIPAAYIPQMQMQMWVSGLPLCDFVLYTPEPEIPSVIWTLEASEKAHATLDAEVPVFLDELAAETKRIEAMRKGTE